MGLVVFGLRQMGFWDWFGGMGWFRWVYLGSVGFFKKRTFLLSEVIPSGGNAVPYAYAIASVYESFPHEPR